MNTPTRKGTPSRVKRSPRYRRELRRRSAKYVDAPASTKSSCMCHTETKASTTLSAAETWSALT